MSEATESKPKMSSKKILAIVSAVLVLVFGANHLTVKLGYAMFDVAVNDSTIVVTPMVDTTVNAVAVDTAKVDSTQK